MEKFLKNLISYRNTVDWFIKETGVRLSDINNYGEDIVDKISTATNINISTPKLGISSEVKMKNKYNG